MDFYSVEIENYPDFDRDGHPDSEISIYQKFREKFSDLAGGDKNDFQFSCDVPFNETNQGDISWEFEPFSQEDKNRFLSNNPLTSIFYIRADADVSGVIFEGPLADEGAIMVSDFTNNGWVVSTITTPSTSSQPFSGNRQWGWNINSRGLMEFYTRAVDVATIPTIVKALAGEECTQDTYYNIAEATWKNLQMEIVEWIEDEGNGEAKISNTKAIRIDREKIKLFLESNVSIEEINANCN